jgi:hypothetical protein
MPNTNTAIESLRSFALAHNEIAFAHLCTAALEGEEWAVELVDLVLEVVGPDPTLHPEHTARIIRIADTMRPDGAIARTLAI